MIKCIQVKANINDEKAIKMFCPYCKDLLTHSGFKRRPELRYVRAELVATKRKLPAVKPPFTFVDMGMLNTIMQEINAINEKLENKIDPKTLANQVIKEVLNPLKTSQKLSKSDQIRLAAAAKTDRDNLKLIQKQARNNKYGKF